MIVTGLFTYPIKSLAGIELNVAPVSLRGLHLDRRWMLVDEDGLHITQREIPEMALLQPGFEDGQLIVRHKRKDISPLRIGITPLSLKWRDVQVWDYRGKAVIAESSAERWFSEALQYPCQLVYMPEEVKRPLNPKYGKAGEIVGFADSCPLLVIGENTLAELNQRLEYPVPMDRFRPNIVFSGGDAYEEESWASFRIGKTDFRGIRACGRCQMIGINQDTAAINKEPLRTLSTYRNIGNKVIFGLHASWIEGGKEEIRVGEEIEVLGRR
jgi:uncharacterized protein YcbX